MQEPCLESQVKKVIQNDFVDSVYSANGDVRIGECVIKTASAKRNAKFDDPDPTTKLWDGDEEIQSNSDPWKVGSDEDELHDFQCKLCNYNCDGQDDLLEHMTYKHARERKHKCDQCDFRSYTNNSLKRHKQTHSAEKPFLCEVCQKRFHFSDYLKRHMSTHRDKERQFKCTKCNYCSAYNCNLQYHIAREHSTSKLFMCDVCDYKFVTSDELKKHLLSHSPLNFDDCDISIEIPKKPKRVRKETAPASYDTPYKCYDCTYTCTELDLLIQHIEKKCGATLIVEERKQSLPSPPQPPPPKPLKPRERRAALTKHLKCNECDYATSNGSHLRRHMQAKHSTECEVCDFKGTTVEDLRQHRPIHNEKKPFKCTQCIYNCTRADLLRQHLTKKHNCSEDSQS